MTLPLESTARISVEPTPAVFQQKRVFRQNFEYYLLATGCSAT